MSDGLVQVQPDSTGAKIDTSELTRDDGTIVDRQRVALADAADVSLQGQAAVREQKLQVEDRTLQILEHISETLDEIHFKLFHLDANS